MVVVAGFDSPGGGSGWGSLSCSARIDVPATMVYGTLYIGSVLMHRPAWAVIDVTDLWFGPDVRGEDLLIPGRPGRIPFQRRAEVTEKQIPMVIDGRFTPSGHPFSGNEFEGLRQNLAYLRATVTDPTHTGDGTRVATLYSPTGGIAGQAPVHVISLEPGAKKGSMFSAVLTLSIPSGSLS